VSGSRIVRGLALSSVLAAMTVATSAKAEGTAAYPECGKVSPANANAAHGAFVAGKASFDSGDYSTALVYLKDAYRRDCRKTELLLLLARAYELLGTTGTPLAPGGRRSDSKREAARALEVYLQRAGDATEAATQRERLARVREEIAREDAEDAALAAKRSAAEAATAAATPATTPSTAGAPPIVSNAPAAEPRSHTALPWVLAGAGAASVIAGVVVYVVGHSDESTASNACPTQSRCAPDVASQGNRGSHEETAGGVLLAAGGAALVGGLVWHFVEPTSPSPISARFDLAPLLAPGLAGVGLHASF
jgi:hypothetical protein